MVAGVSDQAHPAVPGSSAGAQPVPLLTSKIAPPPLPDGLVARPHLMELLELGARGPLTVLAAPAGWGKTALLNAWARGRGPAHPVSWLTIEAEDDGDRFWSYLHLALTGAGTTRGEDHQTVPAPGLVPHRVYLARLANAVARLPVPVVVVLDDFHLLPGVSPAPGTPAAAPGTQRPPEASVPAGLEFLLRHTAGRLHLVVATREAPALPLHRWRLSGELTELGARELSFTLPEAAQLLARHGVELPEAHLAELHARTEGWPAGLRLAALAMRRHPDPPRFVDAFSGDQQDIAEYLTGEVLAGQPPETLYALLCTSVLERVCGGLMDALTGRTDGERILADLERRNAFVIALPGHYPWYRYHRLFAELLAAELHRRMPDRPPELHRAAAAWYAVHGLPADALRHALAAQDWGYATALLADHWPDLVLCGADEALRPFPPSAIPPAEPLPPPDDAARADPELAMAYVADRLDAGDLGAADGYLRLADDHQHLLNEDRRDRFVPMSAAFHLAQAQRAGEPGPVMRFAAELLALAHPAGVAGAGGSPAGMPAELATWAEEPVDDASMRAIALAARGSVQLGEGDLAAAADSLSAGLAAAERGRLPCAQLLCAGKLSLLRAVRGELRAADAAARNALALPPCPGRCRPLGSGYAYLALALVRYHWDRLGDAERYLDLAAALSDPVAEPTLAAGIAATRAGLLRDSRQLAAAYEVVVAARRELGGHLSRYLQDWLTAVEADLRTSYGDTDTARELLMPLLEERHADSAIAAVALARAYLRDDDPGAAMRVLPVWDGDRLPLPLRLEAGLLAALASRMSGDDHRAGIRLERVLQLAEPEGFRHLLTHVDPNVRELLVDQLDAGTAYWSTVSEALKATAAPPAEGGLPPSVLAEPLSERELTVLRYLQGALSNLEIASDLSLSVNTVKTHVRSIYRKLHADHRREAVLKARQLRLI
jgi:LuxR family maltose regulon positive regulatory protein